MLRRIGCLALILLVGWTVCSGAQKGAKDASSGSSSQSGGKDSGQSAQKGDGGGSGNGGGGGGFSIEAELIGYKSLQSDSEAIACDVAGYLAVQGSSQVLTPLPQNLRGNQATTPQKKKSKWNVLDSSKICENAGGEFGKSKSGVIVTSSADATLGNFQLWRVNMAIIQALLKQAEQLLPNPIAGNTDTAAVGFLPTDASGAVDLVKSVLGIFAVNESVSGVTGTIQDQALVDGVSRQLRDLGVTVVVPGLYSSYTFSEKQTPFLEEYVELIQKRSKIATELKNREADAVKRKELTDKQKKAEVEATRERDLKSETEKQAKERQEKAKADAAKAKLDLANMGPAPKENETKQLQALLSTIDTFIAHLNGTKESQPSAAPPAPGGNDPTTTTAKSQQSTPSPSDPSPLAAIIAADGLAARLKEACPTPTPSPDATPKPEDKKKTALLEDACLGKWRVLTLKALESGGTILTGGNLFTGNRVHYSGGSVATYALFQLKGDLSCSGNVYDYGGYISPKKFRRELRKPNIDPDEQLIFFRGRCSPQ